MGGYIASLVSSKVATIALQAATIALNMALTMGISVALQALITGLNNFIHSAKNASEAADELKSKSMEEAQAAQEEVAQLDELIEKYKKLATSDTQDSSTRNEIRDVQSQIVDLVGQQAGILAGISVRNGDAGNSIGEINITIPIDHVENYDDFVNQLRQDKKFEQLIQSMTVDRLTGGSSLAKNKYKW